MIGREVLRVAAMSYRVIAERDESGAWTARVASVPGCHTYARSLRGLRPRIREALSLWVDDAETAELEFDVRLPAGVRREVREAVAARERADRSVREAATTMASTARALERRGFSRRDVAELLGVSHQRVHQIAAD